jgi:hypothetical protein
MPLSDAVIVQVAANLNGLYLSSERFPSARKPPRRRKPGAIGYDGRTLESRSAMAREL